MDKWPSLQNPVGGLILASLSESRRSMLSAAGLNFRQIGSGVDEHALRAELETAEGWTPARVALALARSKALAVSAIERDAHIIGADQVLDVNGAIWDKPGSRDKAREQLLALKGNEHKLHSAVCFALAGEVVWEAVDTAHIRFRNYSTDFVDRYLALADDSLFNCVGACQIEALGVHLFERVSGDFFTILGLPLLPLLGYLREAGLILR
ncbi:MAG: nucleoside triphosphate pyrophosphatase [Hyphomicrobiales bacterium]|nr:nucleoside triphosphate pyrophosphatase [Hyphomicrobiales bacterium]